MILTHRSALDHPLPSAALVRVSPCALRYLKFTQYNYVNYKIYLCLLFF
jgi:hypothetical protein